ncbi:tRNA-dihydrouridine synthase [Patescibacteria group bacterium]|nr:tRNA-dihydrouridine synthase [Patescibacteria group bacterium]MBU1256197.1 tRNA-dihydrouridine synthase [Patescibacteria group bacterium]MBU1457786.1 tRNA-dihydrouridine synthase [Patescibacteria group bacterium]
MIYKGFWETIKKPVVGLAPMDGVTDAAMRFITKKHGNPDVMFTEFVSAEGIRAGAVKLMKNFIYDESERPIVAQLFGKDPEAFKIAALKVMELGFDGVDINMGCPARKVAKRGEGAGLINNPKLALQIIKEVKKAVKNKIPVSVKTRIGYDKPMIEEWIGKLLEAEPVVISLHGRTLKQGYGGLADWEEIGKAAKLCKETETLLLGNGDVKSVEDGKEKIKKYGGDGFLIGRAAFGNPWVFNKGETLVKKFEVALEHARKFEELYPDDRFFVMRKHLSWYAKGFDGAKELRSKLVRCDSAEEVKKVILGQ